MIVAKRLSQWQSPLFKVLAIAGGLVVAAVCAILADFLVSLVWRPATNAVMIQKPYVQKEDGWYELQPHFAGHDQFGPLIFAVETDGYGFRRKPGSPSSTSYDVIFLGDSFTYGISGPWEETFVGMFASGSSKNVLNGGVASYSPTAYLYQYQKALAAKLLPRGHTVIVAVDISDVQDEAGMWTDGETHPRKVRATSVPPAPISHTLTNATPARVTRPAAAPVPTLTMVDMRAAVIEALPNTWAVYRFIRYDLLRWNRPELTTMPRSAFTYRAWADLDSKPAQPLQQGYGPLGVAGGLSRVTGKLHEIMDTAKAFDARVYLLIYPWPAQVAYADRFSWSAFVSDVCRRGWCAGVIDTIPAFRSIAARDKAWLNIYYISGDTHFSVRGNRVVADAVLATIAQAP
jgi:hypothetical protein